MGPDGIVVVPPPLDQYFSFLERIEDLAVKELIPKFPIEAFIIVVLPRAAWLDTEGLHPDPSEPVSHSLGRELGAVIGTNVIWWTMLDKEIGQDVQDIV